MKFAIFMMVFCVIFFAFDIWAAIYGNNPVNFLWAGMMVILFFVNLNTYKRLKAIRR